VIGGGITPIPARVQANSGMAAPATAGELRSFLGTIGFFCRFVLSYAERASALTDLPRAVDAGARAVAPTTPHPVALLPGGPRAPNQTSEKGTPPSTTGRRARVERSDGKRLNASNAPIELSPAALAAFADLKHALATAPVLMHADTTKPFVIMTDAEENWSTYDKEAAAVIAATDTWSHLLVAPFVLYTDNIAVSRLMTQVKLNDRQAQWVMLLTHLPMTMRHRRGADNPVADMLSRPAAVAAGRLNPWIGRGS